MNTFSMEIQSDEIASLLQYEPENSDWYDDSGSKRVSEDDEECD